MTSLTRKYGFFLPVFIIFFRIFRIFSHCKMKIVFKKAQPLTNTSSRASDDSIIKDAPNRGPDFAQTHRDGTSVCPRVITSNAVIYPRDTPTCLLVMLAKNRDHDPAAWLPFRESQAIVSNSTLDSRICCNLQANL